MKTVLQISGPSCVGKSTIEAELGKIFPGTYLVSFDKLKWQLFGYHRDKHRDLIKDMLVGFFEVVCKQGLPIFTDVYIRDEKEYRAYATIAERHGYKFVSIALTAPTDVLLERFRERVERAMAAKSNISVKDEATYLKNLSMPAYVPEGIQTFDTSVLSMDTIVAQVRELL